MHTQQSESTNLIGHQTEHILPFPITPLLVHLQFSRVLLCSHSSPRTFHILVGGLSAPLPPTKISRWEQRSHLMCQYRIPRAERGTWHTGDLYDFDRMQFQPWTLKFWNKAQFSQSILQEKYHVPSKLEQRLPVPKKRS